MLAYGVPALHAANLTLGAADSLSVDYSASGSQQDLNNGILRLSGGTTLLLSSCGEGDGKTYILFTGVTRLVDAAGNTITLDSSNNAISNYFDTTQPGSGFWANGTLQLNHGALQLVLHNETVKEAITITSRTTYLQYYAGIAFEDISNVSSSDAYGGATYGSTITLCDNGSVSFSGNTASSSSSDSYAYGGAIYGNDDSTITLSNNGSVSFSENTASSSSYYSYYSACGGAIYGGTITLSDNGSVVFEGNTASSSDTSACGGAIYVDYSTITLSDNESVAFIGNTASGTSYASGGAIYGASSITLSGNGSVSFSGNTASASSAYGGAIDASGDLSIRNNDSVEFYQNAEVDDGSYRLRSIDAYGGNGDEISLSAAAGKSITFYDSVYIGSGATVNLNQDYTYQAEDGSSVTIKQQGDIIFTGKYTEQHLNELLDAAGAGRTATASEIQHSRTTEVNAMTNLYGGRLRVEDGAVYKGYGITAHEGSAATVRLKDASLAHGSCDLTFNAGTTLELVGNNTISGNVLMKEGSTLSLDGRGTKGMTTLAGALSFAGEAALSLNNWSGWSGQNAILLFVDGYLSGWDDCYFGENNTADIRWVNGDLLVLNYNEETINLHFRGDIAFTNRNASSHNLKYYNSVSFENISTASYNGGAIYGSTITLSDNGSVEFSGNTASDSSSAYGGAIEGSTITLSDNGSVEFNGNTACSGSSSAYGGAINGSVTMTGNGDIAFSGNTASSDSYYAEGGAIYGSTITLSDNGSVEFNGNTASSGSSYARGGAIYGYYYSTITLRDNGSVEFIGNTASSGSSSVNGGAICASGNLSIRNNDSVLFEKNAEISNGTYRLRSIYAYRGISLSSAAGKSIEFRDAVYIGAGSTVNLNADYGDIKQQGDIIFTGKYTEQHLNELLDAAGAGRTATAEEIFNSRTTEVYTMTNLYGGRLRVEDGAIYKGYGITVAEKSSAEVWLRNAQMLHQGHNISFGKGTTFGLRGCNVSQTDNLSLAEGSFLSFDIAAENISTAVLTHTGTLTLGGSVTVNIGTADSSLAHGQYKLLQVTDLSSLENWSNENLKMGDGSYTISDIEWVDNTLCFNYSGQQLSSLPILPEIPESEIPDTPVTPDEPEIPDTPVTPEKPEGNKTVRPSGNTISTSEVTSNSKLVLEGKGTLTLNGKVSPASISVNISKNLTLKGAKTGGALAGDGDLTKKGNGALTLNDGNGSWTGDTHLLAGTIKVKGTTSLGKGDVYVKGGTLNLGSKAIGNDIIQSKNAAIKSGKKFTGTYTLENGELQKGSTLNIAKTATLAGGTVNGALSGTGKTEVTGNVKLGDKGKITTKALTLDEDATLTTSAKGLSSKATTLTIGENALFSLGGKMTVDSLKLNGGELKTTASKPAAMTVKNNMELTGATLTTNGKVTTNRLTLSESTMTIKGAKAQNLTVKQSLTLGSGSNLRLNGKLSAGSLTIRSGGTLTMSGSKPVTLKVKGALTLNSGSSIIMDYDFVQGKTYKVLTFGSYSGSKDYYSIFGVDADDCTITNTGKALTLTVTGKWNPQTQQKAVSAETPVVSAAKKNPVADALVQSNWGQLEASRAFVNAMANRSMAVQLGNGERAVWASAIGASSRHSSAGGHAGADTNVSGGAFGLETQVGRASLFGMALGNSRTRVSAHGFGTIEQDTSHLGIYGQTNWRSGISADWSAAYGRSESESMGSDWNQKHLQLDGRVSYNHELNARTVLSPFAGVQYYASDSASIGTTDTGSLQNLRAEIGVAASRRVGKFGVYGEIALHQDIARNNPSVSMEGVRYTGMNPGRAGLNFTVGASYELSDKWSVNASYTGEFVENANAHSANVGATYKF